MRFETEQTGNGLHLHTWTVASEEGPLLSVSYGTVAPWDDTPAYIQRSVRENVRKSFVRLADEKGLTLN